MEEVLKPIITEVGIIIGRDAIYLDKVNFINEQTFELVGGFTGSLCENLDDDVETAYSIIFNNVHLFKMMELDFDEYEYVSSFDLIENSKQLYKMITEDLERNIKKIDNSYQHFIFRTYDTVFEIVGKDFKLILK